MGEDDKKILYQNKVLGVARLRQLKTRNDSCTVHEDFLDMFLSCYDGYSKSSEDKEAFGLNAETAWTFHTAKETDSIAYWGKVATYQGGGFYQDLGIDRNSTQDIITNLKKNLWITRGTRCVFVDFSVYNANLNLFCILKIVFEFPPTGGVFPSYSFKTLKLIRYFTTEDYIMLACEITIVGFLVYFMLEELKEICYFRWKYLKQFWNYIDLIILLIGFSCLFLGIFLQFSIDYYFQKYLNVTTTYANFEYVAQLQIIYNYMLAIFLFFVYIKIFKYLSFNKTMGQLNNTLHKCALDIIGFSVMFLIIFVAYAELGYLLFGTRVAGFSSLGIAMFTLLRTILGDFDYMEIEQANRILAPLFFLSYIFLVFFVLLNMFLAIINDTYSDVKTEISVAPDEMQMSEYLKRGFFAFLSKIGCEKCIPKKQQIQNEYNVTIEEIRGALKKCGFTDLEIEMFLQRYNIDPTAEVGNFDINKILADLDEPSRNARSSDYPTGEIVTIDEFILQQERLSGIEKTLNVLIDKVDALLHKLDTMDNVKKS